MRLGAARSLGEVRRTNATCVPPQDAPDLLGADLLKK